MVKAEEPNAFGNAHLCCRLKTFPSLAELYRLVSAKNETWGEFEC